MNSIIEFAPGIDKIASGSLYPHQADGVAFLLSKKRVILGDDMGLGKTRQAIVAMEAGAPEGVVLVVCPASLKLNWQREILMVDPDAAIEVIGVNGAVAESPRWVIVNYDIVGKHADRLHGIDTDRWDAIETYKFSGFNPAMTGNDGVVGINEDRALKVEFPDTVGNLPDLLGRMVSGVRLAATQRGRISICDFLVAHGDSEMQSQGKRKSGGS